MLWDRPPADRWEVAVTLGGFADAREIFGVADDFDRPDDGAHPLTLVRSLEHIYNNGASTVVAGARRRQEQFERQHGRAR